MNNDLKTFRRQVIDPKVPPKDVRNIFNHLIRDHPDSIMIIQAIGILYVDKDRKEDAKTIFRRVLLPVQIKENKLSRAFFTMLTDR
jgi:hypothetical protein